MSGFNTIARLLLDDNQERVRSHLAKRSLIRAAEAPSTAAVAAEALRHRRAVHHVVTG